MARYIDIDFVEYLIAHYGGMVTWNKKEILGEIRKQAQIHSTADVAPKSEVAREIFEEIEKLKWIPFESEHYVVGYDDIAELKKKYEEPKV